MLSRRQMIGATIWALVVAQSSNLAEARRGRGRGHDDEPHHNDDYEQARTAVGTGEALPLSEILVEVKKVIDGDVLDVELVKTDEGLRYSIRLLARSGTYHRVTVDAKTKIIVKVEQQ